MWLTLKRYTVLSTLTIQIFLLNDCIIPFRDTSFLDIVLTSSNLSSHFPLSSVHHPLPSLTGPTIQTIHGSWPYMTDFGCSGGVGCYCTSVLETGMSRYPINPLPLSTHSTPSITPLNHHIYILNHVFFVFFFVSSRSELLSHEYEGR